MEFNINILNRAIDDIQQGMGYYQSIQNGLDIKFYNSIDKLLRLFKKIHISKSDMIIFVASL